MFIPREYLSLTREERKKALRAITLINHKRLGKVKGRTVAIRSVQREYIPADEASSPTATTKSVQLTLLIGAIEERIVAVCDISGAFLQAYMDDLVLVMFEDKMVDLLVETEPKYKECVYVKPNGKKVLYVQLRKAMYGCLKAARLWWEELSEYLVEVMGFKLNQYNCCVANKMIKNDQCTIIWHVDDLKITHKDCSVVEEVIKKIEEKFEKMSVNIGVKHTYVGMDLDFSMKGTVIISMKGYLEDAIKEFPGELPRSAKTPASLYLFEVNPEAEKLDEEKPSIFHRVVAMLLFVSKRARPDIQVAIAFLTTRTMKSDVDDWKKLARLIAYLKSTIDLKLYLLGEEGCPVIKW